MLCHLTILQTEMYGYTFRLHNNSNLISQTHTNSCVRYKSNVQTSLHETYRTHPTIHLSHNSQCIVQNNNVNISTLNGVLWDMGQVDRRICEIGLSLAHALNIIPSVSKWSGPFIMVNFARNEIITNAEQKLIEIPIIKDILTILLHHNAYKFVQGGQNLSYTTMT